ncbi:MAG: hypothetical protein ACRBF0_16435 [Calditrichia bacterium]
MNHDAIINQLFEAFKDIRYVSIYQNKQLTYTQREAELEGASSGDTDRFEELLVNPTLLKLAGQRGDIDCGGLDYMIISYGNFFQLVKSIEGGHLSIALEKGADISSLPGNILSYVASNFKTLRF